MLGCSGITPCDNQKDLPQHIACIANPIPIERNFQFNNQSHNILVAVIDTGIDYNHPELMNHIHFELDENGRAIRWGWDFVGQDGWPSPYIGRRTINADQELAFIDGLIEEQQPLSPYLDKRRNVVQDLMLFMTLLDELMVGNESYRSIGEHLYQSGKMNSATCFGTSFAAASAANVCAIMWIDQGERISVAKIVESVKRSSLQE